MITSELDGQSVILVMLKVISVILLCTVSQNRHCAFKSIGSYRHLISCALPSACSVHFSVTQIVPPTSFYCDCCSFFRTT